MPVRNIGLLVLLLFSIASSAQSPSPASTPKTDCDVTRTPPTLGEIALAGKKYQTALKFYQDALLTDAESEENHLGVVEALIGTNNAKAALEEAHAMSQKHPDSSIAIVATVDALYRSARFVEAFDLLRKEMPTHTCEARLHARYGRIAADNAMYATAWKQFDVAHKLRPNDEIIRRQWISTLSRQRRMEELDRYLQGDHSLSSSDSVNYASEQDLLKAHRARECTITSKAEATAVPFKPIFQGGNSALSLKAYGLDASFNGKRRRMQIDSGASGITLSASAAKDLNLIPEHQIRTGGIGDLGDVASFVTHVEHIAIGDIEVSNCLVSVLGKTSLDVDGLIGPDFFSRWIVTLNYPEAKLSLAPLPRRPEEPASVQAVEDGTDTGLHDRYIAPQMADWMRVIRIGHAILLPVRVGKLPDQHYLIADTGASTSMLSITAAQQAGKLDNSDVRITGLSGEVKKVYWSDTVGLIFGHFSLQPDRYVTIDLSNISHNFGTEISGFVGLPTLARLTISIDYRDNLVKMSYDAKKDNSHF